ncbi:exopolysaccharide biosynthesis protein [Albibacillus kandeliae]|uniref:exopolysaccharide biosynthesis protein n=1 Tax=Albibacillus kandeliae TaxID=2174228 RepID=UPI000D69D7AA|nr:exopolysaccharide biosynthesis protein [Albibacillus kandeliae]
MTATQQATSPRSLTELLDILEEAPDGKKVTVAEMLRHIGDRSFTPLILAISVIVVSPISGIPTVPTFSALLLLTIGVQGLARRDHLWLPGFLMRRQIPAERLHGAINWLRKPCAWIDRHSRPRLRILTEGAPRVFAFAVCTFLPLVWPPLELLPMFTSVGAFAIALIAFGLLTHDGLYTLLGYSVIGAGAGVTTWFLL